MVGVREITFHASTGGALGLNLQKALAPARGRHRTSPRERLRAEPKRDHPFDVSDSLIKAQQHPDGALDVSRKPMPAPWRTSQLAAATPAIPWSRYLAALRRYKWLVLAIVIAGAALGFAATRLITPEYEVQATIWISTTEESRRDDRGPIRSQELLNPTAWLELFKSFAVLDPVVREMKLYLAPERLSDTLVFTGFELAEPFRSGAYVLTADRVRGQYALTTDDGLEVDRGALGDSAGRSMGFRWVPDSAALVQRGSVEFLVVNPRDVSVALRDRVTAVLPERSNFLRVTLGGTDPQRTENILNTWIHEFVATAAELKKRNLVELEKVLDAQLSVAASGLRDAESALRSFRARTITLPSDRGVAASGEEGSDPVLENFFSHRTEYENVRHDRQVMEERLRDVRAGTLAPEALLSVPSAEGWMEGLRAAITDLHAREAELETARERYTDEHQSVRELRASIARLRSEVIPEHAGRVLAQLERQESDLGTRIQSASRDLRGIPDRAIEEMRLRRELASAQDLHATLQSRYEEARLAEASAVPDVSILDEAVAPQWPTRDRAPAILMLAFLVSIGVAVAVALLLDHMDRRFRYPEQAAEELGLSIVGTVPPIDMKLGAHDPAAQEQVTEAFRSIRMHLEQAFGTRAPVVLTISSPGVGDGKSLVSSRLAMAFAEAGHRTLLVDGDIRRGRQHAIFDADPRPGLLDYLGGDSSIKEVVQPSSYENLAIIARGAFRERGPELLSSDGMSHLIAMLEDQYDAVIVDSPPLGANIDPVALGTATGAMLLVLRSGETDRRVAEAKVRTLEYFPIRLLGAVVNDFALGGAYQQYHYLYWSGNQNDEEPSRTTSSHRPSRIGAIAPADGQEEATSDALESRTS